MVVLLLTDDVVVVRDNDDDDDNAMGIPVLFHGSSKVDVADVIKEDGS